MNISSRKTFKEKLSEEKVLLGKFPIIFKIFYLSGRNFKQMNKELSGTVIQKFEVHNLLSTRR